VAEICPKCIILVTNFQKTLGALRSQRLLTFNFSELKLRDLVKLRFFNLIMMKTNWKKQ